MTNAMRMTRMTGLNAIQETEGDERESIGGTSTVDADGNSIGKSIF